MALRKARQVSSWIADRPPRRGGPPAPVGQVLAESQKIASQRTGSALTPDEWQRIVGPKIALRTRVGRLVRGKLTVHAASSAWCNELSFLATEIVERLRAAGWPVDTLRVRVGSFGDLPAEAEPGPAGKATLSPELQARLALIEDPALRAAVAEAAALSLARTGGRKP